MAKGGEGAGGSKIDDAFSERLGRAWTFFPHLGEIEMKILPRHFRRNNFFYLGFLGKK